MGQTRFSLFLIAAAAVAIAHGGAAAQAPQPSGPGDAQSQNAVSADSDSGNRLQEIVVTAQKREQSIQDVGIAITAFSGADLAQRGISNAQELVDQTPGLHIEAPGGPANTTISLRGVGVRDIGPNAEGAVVVYRDGAYASYLPSVAMPMFDIERVEVLKGPQGTLFGRNATGGLIHVISNRPTDQFTAYAQLRAGEFNEAGTEGAVGGALTDSVNGRLSFFTDRHDGWIENNTGPDGGSLENYAGRAQLSISPNDSLNVHLLGYYNTSKGTVFGQDQRPLVRVSGEDRVPASATEYRAYCNSLDTFGVAGGALGPPGSERHGNCFFTGNADPYRQSFNDSHFNVDNFGVTASVDYSVGSNSTFTSISDYQGGRSTFLTDTDGTPLVLFPYFAKSDNEQFSQELRLSGNTQRTRWVLGLYYLDIKIDGLSSLGTEGLLTLGAGFRTGFDQHTQSKAAFVQGEYDLSDQWTLIAGGRWTDDDKDIVYNFGCTDLAGGAVCGFLPLLPQFANALQFNYDGRRLRQSKGDWSGRLELNFKPSDEVLTYASINRGIKSGGFNAVTPAFYDTNTAQFEPETLTAYELGFKSTLFGGTSRLNGAIFHYDYDNFQSYLNSAQGFLLTINVDSKIDGADLEFTTAPWKGWSFNIGASYLDARSEGVPLLTGGTGEFVNPDSPKWSFSGLARYEWALGRGTMGLQVDGVHSGERTTNALDQSALRLGSYERLNARLTYSTDDERWSGALWVSNLTDEQVLLQRVDLATLLGSSADIYDKPRWFGASITRKF